MLVLFVENTGLEAWQVPSFQDGYYITSPCGL